MSGGHEIAETPEERLERYRRMADSTRDLAARSHDPEIRGAYLELAARWVGLAEQAAAALRLSESVGAAAKRPSERSRDESAPA